MTTAGSQTSARRRSSYAFRAIRAYALFLLGTTAFWLIAGSWLAAQRLRAAERGWEQNFGTAGEFLKRHPAREDSPAAKELDRLARRLGTRLIWTQEEKVATGESRIDAIFKILQEYVDKNELAPEDAVVAPPREVTAFIERQAAGLDSLEAFLLSEPELVLKQDVEAGLAGPIPSLLGPRQLQSILLSRAFVALRGGRAGAAERSLDAAWTLAQLLQSHPTIVSRLVAIRLVETQMAVLRRLPDPPLRWLELLDEQDYRESVLDAYRADAYGYESFARRFRGITDLDELEGGRIPRDTVSRKVVRFLTVPYLRLSLADLSDRTRLLCEELRRADGCQLDAKALAQRVEAGFPPWNIVGRIAAPPAGVWLGAVEASLKLEQTRLAIEARHRERQRGGWGESKDTMSHVCPSLTWTHRVDRNGQMTIAAEPAPPLGKRERPWFIRLRPRGRLG